ncbi:MAG: HAMP domain-containing histidine kinase [Alphaproteobacteria bacterium]|nr:HAMP domain-containing histidine kinase [Alphaproteobacteria bacterium]
MTEEARRLASGGPVTALGPMDPDLQPLADALEQLSAALSAQEDDIQQRLALTQQLAAIVAHEVRNPLQSLTMLADVVAHCDDPEERKELLRSIQQELGLIEVVVQRLVSSGDALRLVRRSTTLWALIGRCVRLQGPEAREAGVKLEAELIEAAEGQLDGPLLRRAIENLIRNAVTALAKQEGGHVRVRLEREGDVALVHVDDDGPGVPEEEREDIFRAGVSGRPDGTGLGLPLARRVAEAHGGSLLVTHSPLGGARFTLTLPLHPEKSP